MKQRFGAILCVILGTVLIISGISGESGATVGGLAPTCQFNVGVTFTCPTGQLVISETSRGSTAKPGNWTYTIASANCTLPDGSSDTVTVADGGTATSDDLYVFTGTAGIDSSKCQYTLTETPVADFLPTYDPAQPYTLPGTLAPARDARANPRLNANQTAVAVTNTSPTVTTPAPPSTTAPSSTAASSTAASSTAASSTAASSTAASSTAPASSGAAPISASTSSSAAAASSSAAAALANTGPTRPVSTSVLAGVALCLFGLILLFVGRRPRPARRR